MVVWGRALREASLSTAMSVLKLFRRDPAKNRYVDEEFGVFRRERVLPGTAVSVDAAGMRGSQEWHRVPGKSEYYEAHGDEARGERAILVQSVAAIQGLRAQFPDLASGLEAEASFGENMLCSGLDVDSVCLGDVYRVVGSELRLQATSPRRPCANCDRKHGSLFGMKGVRAFCASSGYAGIFFKVLHEGSIEEGSQLILESRRGGSGAIGGGQWSIRQLSQTLYSRADTRYIVPLPWASTRRELIDLACGSYPELAHVEWGEVLQELLGRELAADGAAKRVRQLAFLIWLCLCAASWRFAPPIRPDWMAWCIRMLGGDWALENPLMLAEFNMMGLWPLLLGAQCRSGLFLRNNAMALPLCVSIASSMCLGCFALAPAIALCATAAVHPSATVSSSNANTLNTAQKILASPWFAGWLLVSGTLLGLWGALMGDLHAFKAEVAGEGFAMIMSFDFLAFWALSMCLAWALDVSEGAAGYRWLQTLVPVVGTASWLLTRGGGTVGAVPALQAVCSVDSHEAGMHAMDTAAKERTKQA